MGIYAYIRGGLAALPLLAGTAAQAQFAPSWSGLYVGLNAGFARGSSSFSSGDLTRAGFTSPLSITGLDGNGGAVGFGGGLNSQFGFLVLGLEGDWTRTNIRISTPFAANIAPFGAVTGTLGGDIGWIASARLRAGLPAGKALLFGTAGLAVARATGELTVLGVGAPFTWRDRALLAGFVYGGGIEYALTSAWSVKAEFLHTQLSDGLFSSATANVPVAARTDIYNFRGGVNFRF